MAKKENKYKEVILLVGPPGSGKSTLCAKRFGNYVRISQDDMGYDGHLAAYFKALKSKPKIIVDRMNHTRPQRARYIEPAIREGFKVRVVKVDESYDVCLERMRKRSNHPTVSNKDETTMLRALGGYFKDFEEVLPEETAQKGRPGKRSASQESKSPSHTKR